MIDKTQIKRIVVVGDAYVSPDTLQKAAAGLGCAGAEIIPVLWGSGDKDEFSEMQTAIEHSGPDAAPYPPALDALIEEADVLMVHFCPLPARLLRRANRLKLVGVCRGGVDNIAVETLTEGKIPLVHIIRNAEAVAEFTLGLMLAETRNIARSHRLLMQGVWPSEFPNSAFTATLKNLTVGIAGLGNIGALLAQKLAALGVKVLGFDAYLPGHVMQSLPVEPVQTLEELFRRSDVISLHLRLTQENQGMIGAALLGCMKPTAYLINAARAGLIDEPALVEALRTRAIAGAALDVFNDEPLRPDSPLLTLDNVTLTPHIAGDTVDAIALSPYPLAEAMAEVLERGRTPRVYNKF